MVWIKNFLEWLSAIIAVMSRVSDSAGETLGLMWDDFPNPVKLINHVLNFFNSLPGAVVSGFALAYWDLTAASLEIKGEKTVEGQGRPFQHVMTPAQAVRYGAYLIEQSIKFLTLSRDSNIVDKIFAALGTWAYNLLKRFETIRKIIGLVEEQDFIKFFQSLRAAKAGSLVVIAVISALVFLMIISIATTGMLMFGGTILEPKAWQDFVLFSQHKREKMKVRISRRVGGVVP